MIIRLPEFMAPEQARSITANLAIVPGATPSGFQTTEPALQMGHDFRVALAENQVFQEATLARRMTPFSMLRLQNGSEYAFDLDNFVIGGEEAVRADLVMSIFLSAPEAYQGGDLVVIDGTSIERIRMNAGDAVIYPANNFHRVDPVRGGERWSAEAFIQSQIRDGDQRQVLAEIHAVLGWISQPKPEEAATLGPAIKALRRARANLGRMWTEL